MTTQLNWQNFWCVLLSSIFFISTSVKAQQFEKECETEDSESCSQPLKAGEKAPFSGQLLTPKLAIKLGQKAASFNVRLRIESEYIEKMYQLDLDLAEKLYEINVEACDDKVDLLTERLKDAKLNHWYQHPLFVASLSVILTTGVILSGAYVFKSMSE